MLTVKVGDEVQVHGRHRGGKFEKGTVVKVGRKLFTVQLPYDRTEVYRLTDGLINNGYGHSFVKTLEQVALDERRKAALEVLSKHRIEVYRANLTVEQLEALADVARTF